MLAMRIVLHKNISNKTVEFLPKWFCLIHNLLQPLLLTSLLFFKSDCILTACQKKFHKYESIDSKENLFQFNMLLKTNYDKENLWNLINSDGILFVSSEKN